MGNGLHAEPFRLGVELLAERITRVGNQHAPHAAALQDVNFERW
jgi:hypothetical protein